MTRTAILLAALLLASCSPKDAKPERRAEIRQRGSSTIEIIPSPGQPPYCLVFTISERGAIRQLTMNDADMSIPCGAGEPVGGVTYRIPPSEGKVRAYILFSDRALRASPIATQINELAADNPSFSAMDLRVPGQVIVEVLEFTPGASSKKPGTP